MTRSITTVESVSRFAGGMFDAVRNLNQSLDSYDVVSDVFSLRDDFTDADICKWGNHKPRVFDASGPAGYSADLLSVVKSDERSVVGHAHGLWNFTNVALHAWAGNHHKPYIVSPHGMLNQRALKYSRWKKIAAGCLFERKFLNDAGCIRALTEGEAQSIRSYGVKKPICIIPNGVDIPESYKVGENSRAVKRTLLYLGRIHPGKNLENLIKAWASSMKQSPKITAEWRLNIAGWSTGDYKAGLRLLIGELGLHNSVVLSDAVYGHEKAALFRSASAFILPSMFEALPGAVLEAWSYSLPVIMTPECNLQEGCAVGAAIEIGVDPSGIARGINQAMSMSDIEREAMGRKGLRLVEKDYAWSDVALKMKMVYDWVIGGGTPPDCVIRNSDEG